MLSHVQRPSVGARSCCVQRFLPLFVLFTSGDRKLLSVMLLPLRRLKKKPQEPEGSMWTRFNLCSVTASFYWTFLGGGQKVIKHLSSETWTGLVAQDHGGWKRSMFLQLQGVKDLVGISSFHLIKHWGNKSSHKVNDLQKSLLYLKQNMQHRTWEQVQVSPDKWCVIQLHYCVCHQSESRLKTSV